MTTINGQTAARVTVRDFYPQGSDFPYYYVSVQTKRGVEIDTCAHDHMDFGAAMTCAYGIKRRLGL